MKAKFIGIEGQPEITRVVMYGQMFFKNEWTDVPKGIAERKLSAHPHFESKLDSSEIAEDAAIKREYVKQIDAQLQQAEVAQEQHLAEEQQQAERNAAADAIADEQKQDKTIDSAVEFQLAEQAEAPPVAPLTEPLESASAYQAREEANQVPAPVEHEEEERRRPGRPKKS
jgi:uncharacterized protein YgbK (DUF1537 family)